MNKTEQEQFVKTLLDNFETIRTEWLASKDKKTVAIPTWTGEVSESWRGMPLWWDYKAWKVYQKWCPKTTEMIRNGPCHRASGWLSLEPHTASPVHDHTNWGKRLVFQLPIIIPEGDTGFDIEGTVHRWTEGKPLVFNGALTHFGFNNTDQQRVIFVLEFDADVWADTLSPYMV
jgi:beta-hydroxylase